MTQQYDLVYAGFWKRVGANVLDGLILSVVGIFITAVAYTIAYSLDLLPSKDPSSAYKIGYAIANSAWVGIVSSLENSCVGSALFCFFAVLGYPEKTNMASAPCFLVMGPIVWLYHAILESSPMQGTLGKKIFGLKIVNLKGEPISFWRATFRHLMKWPTGLLLLVSLITIGVTKQKQALFDMVAGTVVIEP